MKFIFKGLEYKNIKSLFHNNHQVQPWEDDLLDLYYN